ncbi:MAG: ABC transporter substrate-binding protein [Hyphomicrobiaceae bacterium]|nr:ABC transporter substrate-binding protein [Hyphomicrobiaceae bacterium]
MKSECSGSNRGRVLAWVGAVGAVFLAAQPASAADTVKIGASLSITGPASFLGEPEEKTLKIYVDKINAQGGVNGRKLELVVYDDAGDANKARTFATRLVEEDKVVAIVGGSTTGATMAMVPVAEDAKVPFISLAGAIVIVDPVKKFVFKTPHTDRMACEKIFADMKKRGLTKVGIISGTGGFGKSMHDECVKVASTSGVEIVADETYGPKDSDMTPQLTNIKNKAGVQALLNADFGQGPAIVMRNIKQLGITLPVYQSHGVASKSFIDLAGPAAEGVRLPAAALLVADKLPANDPQKPIAVGYAQTYEKETGKPVSTFGGHAYDGLMMLVEAMKRAGSADPVKIRDEIEKTKGFIGTAGMFNMTSTDHMGLDLGAFKMLQIKNGDWTLAD